MAQAHKVLGQSSPSAATLTTLYTVPSATQAIVSTLSVCNTSSTAATYRIAVRPAGVSISNQHYVVYDSAVAANDSVFMTLGITLAATDVLSVYASAAVSFSAFGVEIT
jgi:hypothetical protein